MHYFTKSLHIPQEHFDLKYSKSDFTSIIITKFV